MKPIKITARCPVRTSLEMLGGKWKLLILHQLLQGPLSFAGLKASLPDISDKILAQELKLLARNRLIVRELSPLGISYVLTESGRLVGPVLAAMVDFASAYEDLA